MLEAQTPGSSADPATLAPVLTAEQLDDGWDKLTLAVGGLKTPAGDARVKGIFDAYNAWLTVRWDGTDYVHPHSLSSAQLADAVASYSAQKVVGDQLATQYAPKTIAPSSSAPAKVISVPTEYVTGDVPWWYWPLRIGGGIAAGLFIFRVLRPPQKQLSDLGNKEFSKALFNPNGLTYEQWLRAARKDDEYYGYEPRYRNKLRSAWFSGENPKEWA